jgi:hypothetical protein
MGRGPSGAISSARQWKNRNVVSGFRRRDAKARLCVSASKNGSSMKAEEFTERKQTIDGWKVNVVTYRIGERWYCSIDNVDPGARFARAEGATREEAESRALEQAARYLSNTRKFEV